MGISPASLIIILIIVVLLFGTKRLKSIGSDLGGALKGFKKAVSEDDAEFENDTKKVSSKSDESMNSTVSEKQKEN
jgi:sec-independent protein translocase protein TatA